MESDFKPAFLEPTVCSTKRTWLNFTTRSLVADQRGESLIQVLVGIALMGIMMSAFASMMSNMQRETRKTNQKLASLDLMRVGTLALSNASVCTFMVTNPALSAFDPLRVGSTSPPEFPIQNIPSTASPGGLVAIDGSGGAPASPLSNSLYVSSIRITDLTCGPNPCVPTSNVFGANVTVNFDRARLVGSMMPLKFPIIVGTVGPPGSQTIVNCSGGTPQACPPTTLNACTLPASPSGTAVSGACAGGYTGACSYSCSFGSWTTPSSNTCVAAGCPATTISNCSLPAVTNSATPITGTCVGGTTGSCSYTCNSSGAWSAPSSNTCSNRTWQSCPVGSWALCWSPSISICSSFAGFSPGGQCSEAAGTRCRIDDRSVYTCQ